MKDALGNELHEGDLVMLQLNTPVIWGIVSEIHEGSIVTIQGNRDGKARGGMQPSRMVIASNHTINSAPGELIGMVLALRNPGGITVEKVDGESGKIEPLAN